MTNKLRDFLEENKRCNIATSYGTNIHNRLQNLDINDTDDDFTQRVLRNPKLTRLFDDKSKTEVPIAGYINNKFVSRRIDRLRVDMDAKTIDILDYKTDVNPDERRAHYIAQLDEYRKLISEIHPDFQITCFILWIHDWTLEQI